MALSIRTKLILFISFLILLALSIYVVVAVSLYNKDKKAYIFDTSLSAAESLQGQIERIMEDSVNYTNIYSNLSITGQNPQEIFQKNRNFIEFRLYEKSGTAYTEKKRLTNIDLLKEVGLNTSFLKEIDAANPVEFSRITQRKIYVQNSTSTNTQLPLMSIGISINNGQYVGLGRIKLEPILKSFNQSQVYSTYLLTSTGELIAHNDPAKISNRKQLISEKFVTDIINGNVTKGVRDVSNNAKQNLVVAFAKIPFIGLMVVTEIEKSKAFKVSQELTFKSVVFGVFILGISLILGILFARSLTKPVQNLFLATQSIAQGDFSKPVEVRTTDEIGKLAMSFNIMMSRIVSLMQREKERVGLEKELEVAQRVQSSFIPPSRIDLPRLTISSFYTPSASCGGDWWNYIESDEKIVLMIGDATGHGIPAAMVTAAAASCSSVLKRMLSIDKNILESPSRILSLFNTAVFDATKGQIVMTFFIAVYDKKSSVMKYSCAAHNSPLVYTPSAKPSKKDLKPLNQANGPILGLNAESEFSEAEITLDRDCAVVLYTDGLIECTNSQLTEWGRRNFMSSVISNPSTNSKSILDSLVKNAGKHFNGFPLKDDITLVIAEFKPLAASRTGTPPATPMRGKDAETTNPGLPIPA